MAGPCRSTGRLDFSFPPHREHDLHRRAWRAGVSQTVPARPRAYSSADGIPPELYREEAGEPEPCGGERIETEGDGASWEVDPVHARSAVRSSVGLGRYRAADGCRFTTDGKCR